MKNRRKWIVMGIIAIAVVIAGIVVYNNEKQKAAERAAEAKRIEEQEKAREAAQKAAEEYRAQAQKLLEEGKYDEAQEAMGKALEQTPEDEALAAESEELNQKAEEIKAITQPWRRLWRQSKKTMPRRSTSFRTAKKGRRWKRWRKGRGVISISRKAEAGRTAKG